MLAVALVGVVVYGPALLARAATSPAEPVDFLTAPVDGWRFLLTAAVEIPDARAATPAAARDLAVHDFAGSTVTPTRVDLVWTSNRRVRIRGGGSTPVTAKGNLVWIVTGRTRAGGPLRTVGLIDFQTGQLTYDVRTAR